MYSILQGCCRNLPSLLRGNKGIRFVSSSFLLRVPPPSVPREVPTPLLFVSAHAWDEGSVNGMTPLSSIFADKGFTCLQIDLGLPVNGASKSEIMMGNFESEMVSMVKLSAVPFPPVIVARGAACVIAQAYISSNPARGLVIISPPASNKELTEASKLPTRMEEFNFEPKFPIAILGTPQELQYLQRHNRLCQDGNVDVIPVEGLNERPPFLEVENWLDEQGI